MFAIAFLLTVVLHGAVVGGALTCSDMYDFVEIGTSNWNTLIQHCAAQPELYLFKGISVEPMEVYLNELPDLPNAVKLHAAVVGTEAHQAVTDVYYVTEANITAHNLPYWLKGCNSVGAPHYTTQKYLKEYNLMHLMQVDTVPVRSVQGIFQEYGVCRLKMFKVDVEGMDVELLIGYVQFLWANLHCYADVIVYEYNELTPEVDHDKAIVALESVGYTEALTSDMHNMEENRLLRYNPDDDVRLWHKTLRGSSIRAPHCPAFEGNFGLQTSSVFNACA